MPRKDTKETCSKKHNHEWIKVRGKDSCRKKCGPKHEKHRSPKGNCLQKCNRGTKRNKSTSRCKKSDKKASQQKAKPKSAGKAKAKSKASTGDFLPKTDERGKNGLVLPKIAFDKYDFKVGDVIEFEEANYILSLHWKKL